MKAKQHSAYKLEQRRVTKISDRVEQLVRSGKSTENWNVILAERDPAKQALARRSKKLAEDLIDQDAVGNPVRARFDLRAENSHVDEVFYIGMKDLEMPDERVRVLDWRAPITGVFYDFDCGPASYVGPDNQENAVTLLLRRALQIEDRTLQEISDLDVMDGYTPDGIRVLGTLHADEFLLHILNSPAGNSLREIIGTIQREQHQIIREPRDRPLFLQAAAGSGKSTIALHRLAQILYDLRRRNIPGGKVAVFGPNPVLVKYISRLLPSLQEREVAHLTFNDWAMSVLYPKRRKGIEGLGTKPTLLTGDGLDARRRGAAVTKGSFEFLDALELYLELTAERKLPRGDIELGPSIRCPKELVWQWYRGSADLPFEHRLRFTAAQLDNWARNEAAKLAEQLEETVARLQQQIQVSFPTGRETKSFSTDVEQLLRRTRTELLKAVSVAIDVVTSGWRMGNLRDLYVNLVTQAKNLADVLPWPGERIQQFCKLNGGLRRQRWDDGDTAAMMYLYARVYGVTPDERWAHVVVDEGQDWSPVCYATIRHWIQDESITVVGDLAQGISGGVGLADWEELRGRVFGAETMQVREISRSYRLTRQTLDLGLTVLRKGEFPVKQTLDAIRNGDAPEVTRFDDQAGEVSAVLEFARKHSENRWSVAVVAPDSKGAEAWITALKQSGLPVSLIGKGDALEGRVTVTPVLLSKGLEFDYVAVVGAAPRAYPVGRESAKRLYTAITRAKQQVMVTSHGKLSPLLPGGEVEDSGELQEQTSDVQRRRKRPATGADEKKARSKSRGSNGRRKAAATRPNSSALELAQASAADQPGSTQDAPARLDIMELLMASGVRVVDRRSNDGALWVLGGQELRPLMQELKAIGWRFKYLAGGSRATGNRDAWFTKQKDAL